MCDIFFLKKKIRYGTIGYDISNFFILLYLFSFYQMTYIYLRKATWTQFWKHDHALTIFDYGI